MRLYGLRNRLTLGIKTKYKVKKEPGSLSQVPFYRYLILFNIMKG